MQAEIQLGIIGCGAIAQQYHIPALLHTPGCRVIALCDLSEANLFRAAEMLHVPPENCYRDADALLALPEVQGVLVLTTAGHCELTELAARYGKHVFVTKPMARTTEECERMIRACREQGVQLFVSFMHRYLPGIREAKEALAAGAIGTVQMARLLNAPGATSTLNKWFYSRENLGGGAVMDLGVHGIDLVQYLLGDIETVVQAHVGRFEERLLVNGEWVEPDNEDHAVALYRTRSGCLVSHMISWRHWMQNDRFSMELYGSEGTIVLRGLMGEYSILRKQAPGRPTWVTPRLPYVPLGVEQHHVFVEMLRTGIAAEPDGNTGLQCIRTVQAVYEASERNNSVIL